MKYKKGDIWVSAVLYLTLGIIAISLILTAAIPLITKMKDRNTVIQTKNLMSTLDETIRKVANEGPGSQRELSPFIINAGKLIIKSEENQIVWTMETTALIQEPDIEIKEGTLIINLSETYVEERFDVNIRSEFKNINLSLISPFGNPFVGDYSTLIRHTGKFDSNNKPTIEIEIS